jgi:hypothetical protein
MADLYAARVPYASAWNVHRRTRHPILKLLALLLGVVSFIVLLVVGLVLLIVDIVLLPVRLILRLL